MNGTLAPQIVVATATVLASVLGYLLAGLNEARRDRRTAERERTALDLDRNAQALRDQRRFQLDTLLALQKAVQLMARLHGRSMHFDHMQAREGKYTQLPDTYSDEMHANGTDVILLRNRLLDEDLRSAVLDFEGHCSKLVYLPQEYQGLHGDDLEIAAARQLVTFNAAYEKIMDHIGRALRAELTWLPSTPPAPATR